MANWEPLNSRCIELKGNVLKQVTEMLREQFLAETSKLAEDERKRQI